MNELVDRMIRAARLDPGVYEEVEHDATTTFQAAVVVVIASIAGGIGTATWQGGFLTLLVLGATASLGGWAIWSVLTWAIGTKLLPESETEADIGQLLRTLGFAMSPGVLRVFGLIPGFAGDLVLTAINVWVLAAFVVATRQALDYTSTWRAGGVCAIGFLVVVLLQVVVQAFAGGATSTAG